VDSNNFTADNKIRWVGIRVDQKNTDYFKHMSALKTYNWDFKDGVNPLWKQCKNSSRNRKLWMNELSCAYIPKVLLLLIGQTKLFNINYRLYLSSVTSNQIKTPLYLYSKVIYLVAENLVLVSSCSLQIELLNNKSHGVIPPSGFSSLSFDQVVPYYSQYHLADRNAIYILHR
jgi:hypothetical protein